MDIVREVFFFRVFVVEVEGVELVGLGKEEEVFSK